jgi:hypothetical protein
VNLKKNIFWPQTYIDLFEENQFLILFSEFLKIFFGPKHSFPGKCSNMHNLHDFEKELTWHGCWYIWCNRTGTGGGFMFGLLMYHQTLFPGKRCGTH